MRTSVASAQKTLHYGTPDGADLWVTIDSDIEVPLWYTDTEAAPGDPIGFVHIPLGSDDAIISSRDGGTFEVPLSTWDDASFLSPDLNSPVAGFTSQSILGFYDLGGDPNDPLYGNPQIMVATYLMHTVNDPGIVDSTRCPFVEGFNSANGTTLLGDIDGTTSYVPDLVFACLYFTPNNDPVWTVYPTVPVAGYPGIEVCFDLAGTDADPLDDLHIYQISGPGTYTEAVGGPGGVTSGEWCGTLSAGTYLLEFELDDNARFAPVQFSASPARALSRAPMSGYL